MIISCVQRKERDSNPRTREGQRFSRPPHSTTLPSFRVQRYDIFVKWQKKLIPRFTNTYISIFYTKAL